MKKAASVVACVCIVLCGCTGYREIERGYFVTAIALCDKGEKVEIVIEALASSDVLEEKDKKVVVRGGGDSVQTAFENLKNSLVKPLYFEHLGAAIFEKSLIDAIEFLKNIPNVNYGTYILKTDDSKALLEGDTPNGVLGYDIVSLIKAREDEKPYEFKNRLYNASEQKIPTINFKDGKLQLQAEEG